MCMEDRNQRAIAKPGLLVWNHQCMHAHEHAAAEAMMPVMQVVVFSWSR